MMRRLILPAAAALLLSSCGWIEEERQAAADAARAEALSEMEQLLARTGRQVDRLARSADRILSPLPVMTPREEDELRRFLGGAHIARARALGVRVTDRSVRDSLVASGRFVRLPDSTHHWIVRRGPSPAYVVPELGAVLEIVASRFQERIAELGLPPFRIEITSALRTSRGQARLRRRNANAAAGVSSHEFGTTVDLSYAAFAPPADPPDGFADDAPPELRPHLERMLDLALESVSARKSRELGAIFSQVLHEAQREGLAIVIYERQQTIYHLTVAQEAVDS